MIRKIGLLSLFVSVAVAAEPVDLQMVTRIREEGLHHSKVMETARHLTDVIGPRLTGSPALKQANEWTRDRLASWGLADAHLEGWEFGRGWSFSRCSVNLTAPVEAPVAALPEAWSPGLRGTKSGAAVRVKLDADKDYDKARGTLEGKVVFLDDAAEIEPPEEPDFRRYDREELEDLFSFEIRPARGADRFRGQRRKRWEEAKKRNAFLVEEKVLATVEVSSRAAGLLRLGGTGLYSKDDPPSPPSLVMAAEPYNRILRLLDDDVAVTLEIEVKARFHDDDTQSYNTVAEIPGSDLADELVMVGAHLDSWHPGTGATDNAAGSAVTMEAVRILQAIGAKPRRTIRIALWSGEEQGLRGSQAYVKQHFATRPEPTDPEQLALPEFLRETTWPIQPLPDYGRLSAYFNIDNGSGRIRGIYAEENAGVRPIFEAWLEPFHDLGADTVTLRRTRGTDHQSFDRVGLPGFQFIQDELDYSTRTHHTDVDVYDHLRETDLEQAATILASFLYHAASRDEMLPRGPLPREPERTAKSDEAENGASP